LNTNRNRGLRTGNKEGTAIIVMLGVAAIAGIVFLIMRLYRNTRLLKEQFESVQNQPPKTQYTQLQEAIP
jgi:heme/copper-type cytochrome/quinol oxidase subunit 3